LWVGAVVPWGCAIDQAAEDDSTSVDEDLTALVALPYLSWSEDEADAEKLGVTLWEQERAWDGLNLYTNDVNEAYVMGMGGRRLHSWTLPQRFTHCEHFELLPGGEIVAVCEGQALVRLDRESNVMWELHKQVHHDVAVLDDGTLLVPRGGKLREYKGRRVGFDVLVWVADGGEIVDRWRSWDHLEELRQHHEPSRLDEPLEGPLTKKGHDYYHLNTVEVLPDTPLGREDQRFRAGNILVCLRNVHLIAILDQDTREVVWTWGPGELQFPHMPTMLPSGNILVYDNGVWSKNTRVIELDPVNEQMVWIFEGDPPKSFFSKRRGSNQRLPNGNTLITESDKGHVVEVTPEGEYVWEFWNPELKDNRRKRIYRFMRRSTEDVRELFRRP
jgi:hypothetical protein